MMFGITNYAVISSTFLSVSWSSFCQAMNFLFHCYHIVPCRKVPKPHWGRDGSVSCKNVNFWNPTKDGDVYQYRYRKPQIESMKNWACIYQNFLENLVFPLVMSALSLSSSRRKVRCLARFIPNSLLIGRDCNGIDSDRRGNHEDVFPDSLRTPLFIKPTFNCRVVSRVYNLVHCPVSAPKPQFHCWALTYWSSNSNHLCYYGLASLCQPRKTIFHLLSANGITFFRCSSFFNLKCPWHYSICVQRTQSRIRNSGIHFLISNSYLPELSFNCWMR